MGKYAVSISNEIKGTCSLYTEHGTYVILALNTEKAFMSSAGLLSIPWSQQEIQRIISNA